MNDAPTFDFDFRPEYWDPLVDPIAAITRNVKGEMRRQMITDIVSGRAAERAEVPEALLPDSLDEPNLLGRQHPWFMGGEYLPDYLPGEIEVARIVLQSVTMDVTSVRARPDGRLIRYRLVDEYPDIGPFEILDGPTISARPLTFGEMMKLIDSIRPNPEAWGKVPSQSYVEFIRDRNTGSYSDLEQMARFVTVSSYFYRQLRAFFEMRAREWLARKKAERAVEEKAGELDVR